MKQIRVLVADGRALIRGGIRALLEELPELQIVAEANDGPEALRLIREHQPDVALIGSTMSKLRGFEVTSRVSKECPKVHVIVLSTHADEECMRQIMGCGAVGFLTMTASAAELGLAVKSVANGQRHFCPSATGSPVDSVRCTAINETVARLTPRQREVLTLMAEGKSTKEIAFVLKISVKTVETHRMLLMERLDIHDVARLVRYAIKAGLTRLED